MYNNTREKYCGNPPHILYRIDIKDIHSVVLSAFCNHDKRREIREPQTKADVCFVDHLLTKYYFYYYRCHYHSLGYKNTLITMILAV